MAWDSQISLNPGQKHVSCGIHASQSCKAQTSPSVTGVEDIVYSYWRLLVSSFAAWKLYFANRPSPVIRSLAVLPLESLSNDASQDYFADGMTDELITDLGQIRQPCGVISRTSVMGYKHVRKPLPQIARELNC